MGTWPMSKTEPCPHCDSSQIWVDQPCEKGFVGYVCTNESCEHDVSTNHYEDRDRKESAYSYVPNFENEAAFHEWLMDFFESKGWNAMSEVTPHYSDYRADMLVQDPDSGIWIGLELKVFNTTRGGREPAKALRQISQQYAGKNYFGERVDNWCFVPYVRQNFGSGRVDITTYRELFCYFGIGVLDLAKPYAWFDFAFGDTSQKIAIGCWPADEDVAVSTPDPRDDYSPDWEKIIENSRHKQRRLK